MHILLTNRLSTQLIKGKLLVLSHNYWPAVIFLLLTPAEAAHMMSDHLHLETSESCMLARGAAEGTSHGRKDTGNIPVAAVVVNIVSPGSESLTAGVTSKTPERFGTWALLVQHVLTSAGHTSSLFRRCNSLSITSRRKDPRRSRPGCFS